MCISVQNAISFLWANLLQCGIDIAFWLTHSNRLRLPHGFGADASLDANGLNSYSLLLRVDLSSRSHFIRIAI